LKITRNLAQLAGHVFLSSASRFTHHASRFLVTRHSSLVTSSFFRITRHASRFLVTRHSSLVTFFFPPYHASRIARHVFILPYPDDRIKMERKKD
jgi:hypothetical protein